jgi:hypothetical protein
VDDEPINQRVIHSLLWGTKYDLVTVVSALSKTDGHLQVHVNGVATYGSNCHEAPAAASLPGPAAGAWGQVRTVGQARCKGPHVHIPGHLWYSCLP